MFLQHLWGLACEPWNWQAVTFCRVLITEASPEIWPTRNLLQSLHWLIWKFKLMLCNYGTHLQVTAITLIQISLYRNWPIRPFDPSQCTAAPHAFPVLLVCTGVLSSHLAWHQHTLIWPEIPPVRFVKPLLWGCLWRALLLPTELLNDTGACTWHRLAFIYAPAATGQQPLPVVLLIKVPTTDTDSQGTAVANT